MRRRSLLSGLLVAALAACGRRGPLELPPEEDEAKPKPQEPASP